MDNTTVHPSNASDTFGDLLAMTSHDLSNLLTIILGSTELTALGLPLQHPVQRHLQNSRRAIEQAVKLLDQLRMNDDPHSFEPVAIDTIVDDAIALLTVTLPPSITIKKMPASNQGWIRGDTVQIYQVISNILINAVNAMHEQTQGMITIERTIVEGLGIENLEAAVQPYLRLSISDSGPGIEASIRDRIFAPYFTRSRDQCGTGLGLTIADQVMKRHGGFITVHSTVGIGTTFHVYFPTVKQSAPEEVHASPHIRADTEPTHNRLGITTF